MARHRLLLATLAAYLPGAALPAISGREDVPGGPQDPAVLVVPFCLGFAAAFIPWGRWTDRRDPASIIRVALLASVGAGVLVALAPSGPLLVIARVLQGIAAAGVPPAVQAALAQSAPEDRAGRALSGMMLAVALATLVGPALAPLLHDRIGWSLTALALGTALPLALIISALAHTHTSSAALGRLSRPEHSLEGAYASSRGVRAGWIVSALVLGGYWTVLTRLGEALGGDGLAAGDGTAGLAALTGAIGLPLVVLAARACDAAGPRRTMTATLAVGAAGFGLASTATEAVLFVAAAGVGLAVYWAYLPVVAAQVQRSAGSHARGRAAGGLYASMWAAAGAAGALASLAPSWREVLLGAALMWALATAVAAREFLGAASSAACPTPVPRPSPH